MKQEFKWAEALRISPQQLMEWQDIAPDNVPLQFWAVQEGHITSADYLEWAIDHFQLPVLQDEFFTEQPRLEKKPAGQWHAWLNPIAEWDGVLFVACVEPPQGFKHSRPVQFVLASPVAMQKAWEGPKAGSGKDSPDKTLVLEMPDGLTSTSLNKKSILQLDENATNFTNSGVDLEITSSKPSIKGAAPSGQNPASPAPKVSAKGPALEQLKLNISTPPKAKAPEPVRAKPKVPPAPSVKATKGPLPPPPEELEDHDPSTSVTSMTSVTNASRSVTFPAMKAGKSKLPPAPVSMDDAESPEHAFAWAFAQVLEHYGHAMALQENNNHMVPLFWTPNWTAPKDTNSKATHLDQPSLFRIAGKTRRPYHGFIVESEIHKEFFKAWGFPELPACATAIPIVVREHVWGLILCIGGESAQGPEALKVAEQTGEKLAQYLAAQIAAA